MEQRLKLEGGGWLEVREDGTRARLRVQRGLDGAGIYKAWLRGAAGEMLLGTLAPEGQYLRLERTISLEALREGGCWPVTGGRTALTFSFAPQQSPPPSRNWRWEHRPGRLFSDPVLAEAATGWGPMLWREDEGGFQLAAPLDPLRPFPLTPIFCFAAAVAIEGRTHAMFSFTAQGTPRVPER